MKYQEEDENRRFAEFASTLQRIEKKLEPIADTYESASTFTKWIMYILISGGAFVGIAVAVKNNFLH